MPEHVLGKEWFAKLERVSASGWYPIALLIEPLEMLGRRLGEDSLRKIGRTLFSISHESRVRAALTCAEDVIYGIDTMYRAANRGVDIGGWQVLEFGAGRAVLEKTTPHYCVMEEGILEAALRTVQVSAVIRQERCLRRGDDACHFVVTSHVEGPRWSKAPISPRGGPLSTRNPQSSRGTPKK